MKREKYYSKDQLAEMANLCELMKNDSVHAVRTFNENIAFMFQSFGYKVTDKGSYFLIERKTEETSDAGKDGTYILRCPNRYEFTGTQWECSCKARELLKD